MFLEINFYESFRKKRFSANTQLLNLLLDSEDILEIFDFSRVVW